MFGITRGKTFSKWLGGLKDRRAAAKVVARLTNFELGNFGDVKPAGDGMSESRIDYGPGYRIYFKQYGSVIVVVFAGGTKNGQQKDIKLAKKLAEDYET
ncbi:MAG: type II toxin-antitoxin system RelE/ParE family toxin [Gammaproteobacteria bacterium]|nr:MAG: type II toxin-antitoxin system RelE/ParE family toxin [Gammaproteobacteria bacterium]